MILSLVDAETWLSVFRGPAMNKSQVDNTSTGENAVRMKVMGRWIGIGVANDRRFQIYLNASDHYTTAKELAPVLGDGQFVERNHPSPSFLQLISSHHGRWAGLNS